MSSTPDFTPIPSERQAISGSELVDQPPRTLPSKHSMAPRKLVRLLDDSTSPMYLLDSKNRIRFLNKRLLELIQPLRNDLLSMEQFAVKLLGVECDQRIPSDLQPNREICSLLSLPVMATEQQSSPSIVCLPLPRDALKPLDQWSSVLVIPLTSSTVSELQSVIKSSEKNRDRNSVDRSSFRLCIWIERDSLIGASKSSNSEWHDQGVIQSILFEQRKRYSKLDDFVSLIGTSNSAKLAMNQLQVAIAVDSNCVLYGPVGSEQQRIAKSILEHRRRRQGRSLNAVYILPIECRLMDQLLMSEMLDLATSHMDPSVWKSDRDPREETQVNLLLEGVDTLSAEAIEPLLLFLNRYPKVSVIATADNQKLPTHERQESAIRISSTKLSSIHNSSHSNRDIHTELMSTIGVLRVDIPSLQDRIEDIPILAEQILEQIRQTTSTKVIRAISPSLRRWLQSYSWPGNYLELHRAIRAAVATSKEKQLEPHDLPLAIRTFASHDLKQDTPADLDLDHSLENYERIILKRALAAHQNNRAAAARSLNISRSRLLRRIEQLSIDAPSPEEQSSNLVLDKASHKNHDLDATTRAKIATIDSAGSHESGQIAAPENIDIPRNSSARSARTSSPTESGRAESHDDPDLPIFESID